MPRSSLSVRARLGASFIAIAMVAMLSLLGSSAASAASSDCGAATVSGATAVSSYAQLQTDLQGASAPGSTYYLTKAIADSGSTPGGLVIPAETNYESVTIDLDGCSLSITHPGTATSAITVQGPDLAPQLIITDSSAGHDGSLTAVGGAASSTQGAGAGIQVGAP